MRIRRSFSAVPFVAVILLLSACASPPRNAHLAALVDSTAFSSATWGVSMRSLSSGEVIFGKNEEKLFLPASNMKLFTTAAALLRLGPEFRYTTNLYGSGDIKEGVLHGDLFLRGSGDPTLSDRFHQAGATWVFEGWADGLRALGVKEVRGAIVADETLFDGQYMGTGWAWDDEVRSYSAQISALSFNDNCVRLTVSPGGKAGQPAVVEMVPRTAYVTVANGVVTGSATDETAISFARAAGTNVIEASGKIAIDSSPYEESVTVHRPSLFAVTVLKEILESKGIRVSDGVMSIDHRSKTPDYGSMQVVASYESPPLREIIKHVNKPSHNLSAELLFRTLGYMFGGEGSTRSSVRAVKETISRMGISGDDLSIYDGSGLSRYDMIKPDQVVALLKFMHGHPYFDYFYESLPSAGVEGTLKRRMKGTEAGQHVRAKTGSFRHVLNLSGYMKSRNGEMIAFSIMTNNVLGSRSELKKLQDAICTWLWRFY